MTTPRRKTRKKKAGKKFAEKDFVASVWEVMENQAKGDPAVALLHAKLAPEFEEVTVLAQKLLQVTGNAEEKIIDQILSFGQGAVLPLLEVIRAMKQGLRRRSDG